jgi:hypothetical protein
MRWKLLRRRFSVSAPRVIVRSHMPWPLRWAAVALALGFSAAAALWAFEFGKEIAGLDRNSREELIALRQEVGQLRDERQKAQSIANTAESMLKTERVAQERLAQQLRSVESDNLALKADLGFFERLLPAAGGEGLAVRALQAELKAPGQMRYQMLLMQSGKTQAEFTGRYEIVMTGQLDGRPWVMAAAQGAQPIKVQQYARVEGMVEYPVAAVVKAVQVKVLDNKGSVRASHTVKL